MASNTTPNTGNFDLSAIFGVQKNYLLDLSNSYPNVNSAATVATYVNSLQNQMDKLSTSFAKANTSGEAVLDQQQEMIGIVNTEQERLLQKQQLIDDAQMQMERIALLNNSYRLRYTQYTKMIIVAVIGLCIHIVLRIVTGTFTQMPTAATLLLHVANIVICGIIIIYIYADIQSRDQINFNQLNLPPPVLDPSAGSVNDASLNDASGSSSAWFCYEQGCCGQNTVWDSSAGMCTTTSVYDMSGTIATLSPSMLPTQTPSSTSAPQTPVQLYPLPPYSYYDPITLANDPSLNAVAGPILDSYQSTAQSTLNSGYPLPAPVLLDSSSTAVYPDASYCAQYPTDASCIYQTSLVLLQDYYTDLQGFVAQYGINPTTTQESFLSSASSPYNFQIFGSTNSPDVLLPKGCGCGTNSNWMQNGSPMSFANQPFEYSSYGKF